MLKEFFEGNSVSLEVMETYDEFCLEKSTKKAALNAVRRELYEEYKSEKELEILLNMTLYWCGLQSGFIDEKSKLQIEPLTKELLLDVYRERDADAIYEALKELLKMEPTKPERKKIDYSNPGSKNWKQGDLYAYPLSGEEIEQAGLAGKYAIVYCFNIRKETNRTNYVETYIFLGDEETIKRAPDEILSNEKIIVSFTASQTQLKKFKYKFLLVDCHHEYPTDILTFLGNSSSFIHPNDEFIPPTEIFIPRLLWKTINHNVVRGLSWEREFRG